MLCDCGDDQLHKLFALFLIQRLANGLELVLRWETSQSPCECADTAFSVRDSLRCFVATLMALCTMFTLLNTGSEMARSSSSGLTNTVSTTAPMSLGPPPSSGEVDPGALGAALAVSVQPRAVLGAGLALLEAAR
eukprot:CAMPEP_0171114342 /NCGR_PEP_ID=MMETSP0766_2-20121228/85103_1 /TAXON_ID=439317 /ORGANISM="Gambierdiscus australes, Strain CAWD 149" /LENGTH=134 /DNA_ID=CAMNT_0011576637 /DNA_START=183 /DNA_END=588 /DNA_ORIENTATION=+